MEAALKPFLPQGFHPSSLEQSSFSQLHLSMSVFHFQAGVCLQAPVADVFDVRTRSAGRQVRAARDSLYVFTALECINLPHEVVAVARHDGKLPLPCLLDDFGILGREREA
jgi:hypothetical protein